MSGLEEHLPGERKENTVREHPLDEALFQALEEDILPQSFKGSTLEEALFRPSSFPEDVKGWKNLQQRIIERKEKTSLSSFEGWREEWDFPRTEVVTLKAEEIRITPVSLLFPVPYLPNNGKGSRWIIEYVDDFSFPTNLKTYATLSPAAFPYTKFILSLLRDEVPSQLPEGVYALTARFPTKEHPIEVVYFYTPREKERTIKSEEGEFSLFVTPLFSLASQQDKKYFLPPDNLISHTLTELIVKLPETVEKVTPSSSLEALRSFFSPTIE